MSTQILALDLTSQSLHLYMYTGRVIYNRDELLQLNHVHDSVGSCTLHASILVHMKYLGILQNQCKIRPAHRGKKDGRRRSEKRPCLSSSPTYRTHDSETP